MYYVQRYRYFIFWNISSGNPSCCANYCLLTKIEITSLSSLFIPRSANSRRQWAVKTSPRATLKRRSVHLFGEKQIKEYILHFYTAWYPATWLNEIPLGSDLFLFCPVRDCFWTAPLERSVVAILFDFVKH